MNILSIIQIYKKLSHVVETSIIHKAILYIIYYTVYFYFNQKKSKCPRASSCHIIKVVINQKIEDDWCVIDKTFEIEP